MKKWIAILLVLAMSVTLTGCEDLNEVLAFCGELGELLSAISTMPLEDLEGLEELIPTDASTADPSDQPTAEPTAPATEPTAAPTTPTEPATTPTAPSTEPTAPATQPTEPPTEPTEAPTAPQLTELEALWEQLFGCWACGSDRFVYFTYTDEGPSFVCGYWDDPVHEDRGPALVTNVADLGGDRYVLTLVYPPNEENAADEQDLRPLEYTIALQTDELDKGIIFMETPEGSDFDYYSFVAYSYNDAWDARNQVEYASFEEMQAFWTWLVGYWNSDDGRFICFDQMDSNTLVLMEGVWDSGSRGWGYFEKAMSGDMDLPMEFVIYYPPVSNELDGDLPSEYVRVIVDWMEVETHGRIYVKMGENAPWIKYTFAGYSEADAYPN